MNKKLLLPLLTILTISGCNNNSSISTSSSSSISSSIISSISSSTSSSSTIIVPEKEIIDVDVNELELVENETKTGYLIKKYKK